MRLFERFTSRGAEARNVAEPPSVAVTRPEPWTVKTSGASVPRQSADLRSRSGVRPERRRRPAPCHRWLPRSPSRLPFGEQSSPAKKRARARPSTARPAPVHGAIMARLARIIAWSASLAGKGDRQPHSLPSGTRGLPLARQSAAPAGAPLPGKRGTAGGSRGLHPGIGTVPSVPCLRTRYGLPVAGMSPRGLFCGRRPIACRARR